MSAPKRIQRTRLPGWRMPPNATYVGRPNKWGNPYKIGHTYRITNLADQRQTVTVTDAAHAVWLYLSTYVDTLDLDQIRTELGGRDLACWCPLDSSCHADVLLTRANPTTEGATS